MSMFAKAKSLETPKSPKAKATKVEVQITGLLQLCELDAVIDSLSSIKKTVETDVKDQARDYFNTAAAELKKRPENIRGIDEQASASLELRKRSTASVLTDDEVAALEAAGVPVTDNVKVPFLYAINPSYAAQKELLEKVERVLVKAGIPQDFFVVQEEVKSKVVSDETLDKVFAGADADLIAMVTTLAVKPSLPNPDVPAILKRITKLLEPPKPRAKKA